MSGCEEARTPLAAGPSSVTFAFREKDSSDRRTYPRWWQVARRFKEFFFLTAILAAACSGREDASQPDSAGTGGSIASGGSGGSFGGTDSGGTAAGGTTGTGGAMPTGGSPMGGQATGGQATGGLATGGVGTGGLATGGVTTGGQATGGVTTGGQATGGVGTGGLATGGLATGGRATGGLATGGRATGGVATGGVATGGTDTGTGGSTAGAGGGSGGSGDVGRSAGCGKTRTLTNGRKTIQSGGNREYILRVPDNYDNNKPYRLIMAYHWMNGNATQVAEGGNGGSTDDPYYGLWDLAENSTIFVAPEGLNAGWANSGGQDVTLTDAILEQIENDLCIDTTRIFATGFSYGAGMSYALACARADVFRGVVLYAGAQLSGCDGGNTPIAYMHVHGVGDSVLNISQGRQLRDHYVTVNGCTAQNPPEPAKNSGTHICTSYQGCSEGHPLRWCAHGGDHNPTEKDSGQSKSWVPGEAWEFISQF
jgi:poly(3-hydroxybutyrate) depolymerase